MSSARPIRPRSVPRAEPGAEGAEALLLPVFLMLAAALPFVVVSTRSDQAMHETKLFAQAAAAAGALVAILLVRSKPEPFASSRLLRVSGAALGGALFLSFASGVANHAVVDPLSAVAALSPLALFLAASSDAARRAASRVLGLVGICGAATGLLAFSQRFLGVSRLPTEVPQPRFRATAMIGNPGELAAALVAPALVLWAFTMDEKLSRRARATAAVGFFACALGLGASETIAPILAFVTGLLVHALLAPKRRLLPLGGALLAGALVLTATGAGSRLLEKARELRAGQIGAALTQREIGLAAGLEMVARSPVLGLGPGCYENAFAGARLAAERRYRHRFIHLSGASHFENAHCEPLTFAAEDGLPAAVLALVAFGALAWALLTCGDRRRDLLAPSLLAFSVLSLGTFPLRMPVSAGVFALVAGLAWRLAGGEPLAAFPGVRRSLLTATAALVLVLGGSRLLASLWQARGEETLRSADIAPSNKADYLAEARGALLSATRLRPRSPSAWLALGSCERLDGNVDRAWEYTGRSFALEERAETDFNLGLISFAEWDRVTAQALFVRAVWLHPRLAEALDESYAPGAVELDVSDAESRLASSGEVPELPPKVEALR